jgi:hypothetical protein
MRIHIFLRDGMGANDHGQSVDCLDECLEVADIFDTADNRLPSR